MFTKCTRYNLPSIVPRFEHSLKTTIRTRSLASNRTLPLRPQRVPSPVFKVVPVHNRIMSTKTSALVQRYFPASQVTEAPPNSTEIHTAIFPQVEYTDAEKNEIKEWTEKAGTYPGNEELLRSLNAHLATRTTILGSKPSIADVAIFSELESTVKKWSDEERTGEHGYHHIVRFIDFVQNAPLFGLSLAEEDKVNIDVDKVNFVPKPLDPKEEKERKKKEKEAAAAAAVGGTSVAANEKVLATGRTKDTAEPKSKTDKVKEQLSEAKDAIKGAVAATAAAGTTTKKEKKDKAPKAQKAPPAKEATILSPALIDLRVGHILKAEAHPNADSLYISTIACGDAAGTENTSEYEGQIVRTVCSGLNGLIPLAEMQNRKIVAVCNLKPVTMRGVKSCAMVLAASPRLAEGETDNHAGPVELVSPPPDAKAGERILFDGWEGEPEGVLNPKKKVWEMCQVGFTTTDDLGVAFECSKVEQLRGEASTGKPDLGRLRVKGGSVCTVKSLKGATVR